VITVEDVRDLPLLAGLSDAQVGELVDAGEDVTFVPGDVVFVEGEPAESWWLLVAGRVDLVRHVGREETVLGAMDVPGRWAGGFRAWDDNGAYLATGRAATEGRLLKVPASVLRQLSDAWFPFGGHLIQGLFRTARTFEAVTRQKEALLALGTLAAGLAHEINNPAAAATRAADALGTTAETLLAALGRLASGAITGDDFLVLEALRREVVRPAVVDAMATADREEALSAWLSAHAVDEEWLLAPVLAAAGADVAWCERVAAALPAPALSAALEWVAGTLSMGSLLSQVQESTRRVSELVAAVKSYSQLDRASVQRIDVTEGLESTLVMLGHRIPAGITVSRDYGAGVPEIEAVPGELNQVWTNLIDNAVDAMGEAGTLRVSTRAADDGGVVVEIGDTGGGMPPEVRDHVFEPFFTTKGVGKGTGLGLDISRRIIDRHQGAIEIDVDGGETVLRVRLPLRPSG
jgi:signal transduction histidine kinase